MLPNTVSACGNNCRMRSWQLPSVTTGTANLTDDEKFVGLRVVGQ